MKFKKPKFWDLKEPNLISYLLLPFTLPIILNNFFLKFKSTKKNHAIKTICVGNIYLGGTGKTPTVMKIYQILKDLEINVSTAKKFYSSQYDENVILKKKTNFLTAKNRKEIIKLAEKNEKKVIIFDDGLQDRGLEYDLKFVCFDSESFIGNGFLIPSGPLREKINNLDKYDCVLIKNNSGDKLNSQISLIKKFNPNIKIFETNFEIKNLNLFNLNEKFIIFSGIGSPSNFRNILQKNNFKIEDEIIFADHHNYNKKEIENIVSYSKKIGAKIVTTEKDFVKVEQFNLKEINYIDVNLLIKNEGEFKEFLKDKLYE